MRIENVIDKVIEKVFTAIVNETVKNIRKCRVEYDNGKVTLALCQHVR